jgi:hypothetical protein
MDAAEPAATTAAETAEAGETEATPKKRRTRKKSEDAPPKT